MSATLDSPAARPLADGGRDLRLIAALARADAAERAAATAERRVARAVAHAESADAKLFSARLECRIAEHRAIRAERASASAGLPCALGGTGPRCTPSGTGLPCAPSETGAPGGTGPPCASGETGPPRAERTRVGGSRGPSAPGFADELVRAELAEALAAAHAAERRAAGAERMIATLRAVATAGRARVHALERALATRRAELAAAERDASAAMRRAARAEDRAASARTAASAWTAPAAPTHPAALAGPAVLADALLHLRTARTSADRRALRRALDDVASAAAAWRERL